MRSDELDFPLPSDLIAQSPPPERAAARLLHYRRSDRGIAHRTFADLPALLRAGDLLVFNDARVAPARFTLRKDSGGLVDGLFLGERAPGAWRVLLKNLGPGVGRTLVFDRADHVAATVIERGEGGACVIGVDRDGPALGFLAEVGRMPLPPYIRRAKRLDDRDEADRQRYQTVYARTPGSVAAPTAGLHFTDELLASLGRRGVGRAFVTLHVGLGTFKPVTADDLSAHVMHRESYAIGPDAAAALNQAKRDGRRVVAVGTTSARVLESVPADRPFEATAADTAIFIRPPYAWRHVGALVTNFHLPRSTLIALVAALVGPAEQRRIYETAVGQRYRFFSYGDAMFVE